MQLNHHKWELPLKHEHTHRLNDLNAIFVHQYCIIFLTSHTFCMHDDYIITPPTQGA